MQFLLLLLTTDIRTHSPPGVTSPIDINYLNAVIHLSQFYSTTAAPPFNPKRITITWNIWAGWCSDASLGPGGGSVHHRLCVAMQPPPRGEPRPGDRAIRAQGF